MKTKQTLEELRQFENIDPEDKNILSSQKALENLKNTLSSSELFRANDYYRAEHQPRFERNTKNEARPSSLLPQREVDRSSYNPISEPGKLYESHQSDSDPQSSPNFAHNMREQKNLGHKQPATDSKTSFSDPRIHFEDHDPDTHVQNPYQRQPSEEGQAAGLEKNGHMDLAGSQGNNQMRPTPDFHPPLETIKDESQEGASSYNPFRQNLLNRDPETRTEENSVDSNVPKTRSKKESDSLLKGIKSKVPGGKLRDEDLERIERIFRNRKIDTKAFDLEDSDVDYF